MYKYILLLNMKICRWQDFSTLSVWRYGWKMRVFTDRVFSCQQKSPSSRRGCYLSPVGIFFFFHFFFFFIRVLIKFQIAPCHRPLLRDHARHITLRRFILIFNPKNVYYGSKLRCTNFIIRVYFFKMRNYTPNHNWQVRTYAKYYYRPETRN